MTAACPRSSLAINLLPEAMRQHSSMMSWVPSAALGGAVLLLAGGMAAFPYFENQRYRKTLEAELAKVQPAVNRAGSLDRQIADAQKRAAQLDDFRKRAKSDMDVLAELTKLLPPPAWLNILELNARQVTIGGEIEQAAPLLRTLDSSPLFVASEFNMPPLRIAATADRRGGEGFRIRANRETPPEGR
jgi:Tfp pilus assembly protein PilN